jgi:hypothetical protein
MEPPGPQGVALGYRVSPLQGEARLLRLIALLLVAALPCPALAGQKTAADAVEIRRVEVGLSGCYKPGLWTPVAVVLQGGSAAQRGELSITVPDGDGVPSRVSTGAADSCYVPAGQESRVMLYVRFGRVRSEAKV